MAGNDLDIFDAEFATKQFSGNHSLLIQILGKFVEQHHDFDTLLAQQLQKSDLEEAKRNVHTLKGVSGNLGMSALYNACKLFEEHLAAGQVSDQQIAHLVQVFNQTLDVIKGFTAQDKAPEPQPQKAVSSEKSALVAALKGNEFISDGKMQHYLQSINLEPETQTQLQQAINDLDYPKALQLLD